MISYIKFKEVIAYIGYKNFEILLEFYKTYRLLSIVATQ